MSRPSASPCVAEMSFRGVIRTEQSPRIEKVGPHLVQFVLMGPVSNITRVHMAQKQFGDAFPQESAADMTSTYDINVLEFKESQGCTCLPPSSH